MSAAIDALPQFIEKALEHTGVPGAEVAVVSRGEVVFEEGYGVRDVTTKERVDVDRISDRVAVQAAVVERRGQSNSRHPSLSWDDPDIHFFPGFA